MHRSAASSSKNSHYGGSWASTAASLITGRELVDCEEAISDAIRTGQYSLAIATIRSLCKDTSLKHLRIDGRNIFHMLAEWGDDGNGDYNTPAPGSANDQDDEHIDGIFGQLVDIVHSNVGQGKHLVDMLNEKNGAGDTALIAAVRVENDKLGLKYLRWGADDRIAGRDGMRVHRGVINVTDIEEAISIMNKRKPNMHYAISEVDTFTDHPSASAKDDFKVNDNDIDIDNILGDGQIGGTGYRKYHPNAAYNKTIRNSRRTSQRGGADSATEEYLSRMHREFIGNSKHQSGGRHVSTDSAPLSGGRNPVATLSEYERNVMGDDSSEIESDFDDDYFTESELHRNYREDDTKIHEDTLEEVKKVMKLGDSEKDQKLLKAIKATLWKKAKEAVNAEVAKMDSRPEGVNRMKSERMLSLATKKYINSIKDEIDATLEDMIRKEKERADNKPIDLTSESDGEMRRNYREDDTKIHEDTLEEIKKVMKLGDSEEDQKLLKAIKATLWKKAKEAINDEVSKMDSRPDNVNRMKSERMLSLATKKYINSIKKDIDETFEDMARKEKERSENPSDFSSSESDGKKSRRSRKDTTTSETPEDKPKGRGRKGKKEEPLSITTMSD